MRTLILIATLVAVGLLTYMLLRVKTEIKIWQPI